MPEQFDPYHQWLGIPPKDQPPNNYRLLGIDLFEPNSSVIVRAADRQMTHIRSFQTGKNSHLLQNLLNEITAAKTCLLNSAKKQAYDEELRKKTTTSPPKAKAASHSSSSDFLEFARAHVSNMRKAQEKPKTFPLTVTAVYYGALLLVWVMVTLLYQRSDKQKTGITPSPTVAIHKPVVPPNSEHALQPKPKVETKPVKPSDAEKEQAEPKIARYPATLKALETGAPRVEQLELAPKPTLPGKAPQPKAAKEPAHEGRLPLADQAVQDKVLSIIREVFKNDLQNENALLVAKNMIGKVHESIDDVVARMVSTVMDISPQVRDIRLAFEVIDRLANEYAFPVSRVKAKTLEQMARDASSPEERRELAEAALEVIDEALDEDDFDVAKQLGKQARQLLSLSKDKELLQRVVTKNEKVVAAAKAFADAQEALATLKDKPDDPDANLTLGKYICFMKGNWGKGLPMLIKGSDEKLKRLAETDIAGAESAKEQVNLGDAWWDANGKARAVYWYEKAQSELAGLEKDRVEKRLDNEEGLLITNVGNTIMGKWIWGDGATVDFKKGGAAKYGSDRVGKWEHLDRKTRKYQVSWSNGNVEWLLMFPDGAALAVTNDSGETFIAQRFIGPRLE